MSFEKFKKNLLIIVLMLNFGGENSFAKMSNTKKIVIAGGACVVAAGGAIIYKQIDDRREEKRKADIRAAVKKDQNSQKLVRYLNKPKIEIAEVLKIIEKGVDINYGDPLLGCPLEVFLSNQCGGSSEKERIAVVNLLVEKGADVWWAKPKHGKSFIDIELSRNEYSTEILEILINNRAETDGLGKKLSNKIFCEMYKSEPDLDKIKKLVNIGKKTWCLGTLLHNVLNFDKEVTDENRLVFARILLENGAYPNYTRMVANNEVPIFLIFLKNKNYSNKPDLRFDMLKLFVEFGLNINAKPRAPYFGLDEKGNTIPQYSFDTPEFGENAALDIEIYRRGYDMRIIRFLLKQKAKAKTSSLLCLLANKNLPQDIFEELKKVSTYPKDCDASLIRFQLKQKELIDAGEPPLQVDVYSSLSREMSFSLDEVMEDKICIV